VSFLTSHITKRRLKRLLRKLAPLVLVGCLAIIVVLVHAAVFLSTFGQRMELRQTDLWFQIRGAVAAPKELVIVTIDESTYRELSLSTLAALPRQIVAELLESLARSGLL